MARKYATPKLLDRFCQVCSTQLHAMDAREKRDRKFCSKLCTGKYLGGLPKNRSKQTYGLCPQCGINDIPTGGHKHCSRACALAKQADERRAKLDKTPHQRDKWEVFAHYSGGKARCAHCENDDIRVLQLDHVNNDGAEHRKQLGRGKVLPWIKANGFPPGFQVLCANCHAIKTYMHRYGLTGSERLQ